MTLAPRLAQVRGVATLFFIDERLPGSQGCSVHIEPLAHTFSGNKRQNVELLSAQLGTIIRRFQSQYLWSYHRCKCPPGVSQPNKQ